MRIKRLLAAATVVAATAVVAAPPASAATGYNRCPQYRMCVFTGLNGQGAMAYFHTADDNLGDSVGPQGMDNNIESIWNRTGHEWHLYEGVVGNRGTRWYSQPGDGKHNVVVAARNKVSSLHDY